MAYINVNDIKDKSINNAITQASWTDTDLSLRIERAEALINSYLLKAGYNLNDISNCKLIKLIDILLSKYFVLSDIYANTSISKEETKIFVKWKEDALDLLEKISNYEIILVDENNQQIKYNTNKIIPAITTKDTNRIFKIGKEYTWSEPDRTYRDDDVVGNKDEI